MQSFQYDGRISYRKQDRQRPKLNEENINVNMKRKELQVKQFYESPVCEVLALGSSMGILAASPQPEAGFEVDPWETTEPENPGGTSEGQEELPDWLKP